MADDFNVNINLRDTSGKDSESDPGLAAVRRQLDADAKRIADETASMFKEAKDAIGDLSSAISSRKGTAGAAGGGGTAGGGGGTSAVPPFSPATPPVTPPGSVLPPGAGGGGGRPPAVPPPVFPGMGGWGGFFVVANQALELFGKLRDVLKEVIEGFERLATRLEPFSPQLQVQAALDDVRDTLQALRQAQQIGPELAEFRAARRELQRTLRDIEVSLRELFLPALTTGIEALNALLSSGKAMEAIGGTATDYLAILTDPDFWNGSLGNFEEALEKYRQRRRQDEQDEASLLNKQIDNFFTSTGGWVTDIIPSEHPMNRAGRRASMDPGNGWVGG